MNASFSLSRGVTFAAAMVPMPLTPMGVLREVADRRDVPVRLDRDSIGQLHDQRPAVVHVPVPEHVVVVVDQV